MRNSVFRVHDLIKFKPACTFIETISRIVFIWKNNIYQHLRYLFSGKYFQKTNNIGADQNSQMCRLVCSSDSHIQQNRIFFHNVGQKTSFLLHENNNGADQPAHLRSLISTYVICFLEILNFLENK